MLVLRSREPTLLLLRQYLYFCTSKASKVCVLESKARRRPALLLLRQYLYFCTSKASKLTGASGAGVGDAYMYIYIYVIYVIYM